MFLSDERYNTRSYQSYNSTKSSLCTYGEGCSKLVSQKRFRTLLILGDSCWRDHTVLILYQVKYVPAGP